MSLKEFEKIYKLGEGAYSNVYKVQRISDKKAYALKKIKIMSLSPKEKQNALNEIRILASINHPNIISYKEAFFDESSQSLCIVMEYADEGDLGHQIEQKISNKSNFSETQIWNVLGDIVRGLAELHRIGVYHRDIKPANIFLSRNGEKVVAKIGDMNVSKISENGLCMTQTGTPYYASPQVWKDLPYDSKSDIWSLGCVIYEMIALKPPFQAEDMEGLYKKVTRGIYPRIPSQYSSDLSSVIRFLLQVNPTSRASCQKILKMPSILKYIKEPYQKEQIFVENNQLMKTIKGQNFNQLNEVLPKANYSNQKPIKVKKEKIKSLVDVIDDKNFMPRSKSNRVIMEIDQRLNLDSQKLSRFHKRSKQKNSKIKNQQNAQLRYLKDKQSLNLLNRQRKKSEISIVRPSKAQNTEKISTHNITQLGQLKLPRVPSRYSKIKERLNKQNSLRIHKILND